MTMVRDGVEESGLTEAAVAGVSQLVLTAECGWTSQHYLNYSSFTSPLPSAV